jgi:RHS repeat-associated protein
VDGKGNVWVADTGNVWVQKWTPSVSTTSYVQGPCGLIEQRAAEATSFPLADAHGDITAIADSAGEVSSRQSYDPWGPQLSGPTLEMGYLGAQQRRTDPLSGLIQMGARTYDPSLGAFLSEDPVFGHTGIGTSFARYAHVWDNPLNLYDLNGRDVCLPTPWGGACAGEAAEDVGNAAGDVGKAAWNAGRDGARAAGAAVDAAWDATAGARTAAGVAGDGNGGWLSEAPGFVSDRAQGFVKEIDFSDLEAAGNALGAIGGGATCWYAKSVVTSAPTPPSFAVKAAATATCAALTYARAAQLGTDLSDED